MKAMAQATEGRGASDVMDLWPVRHLVLRLVLLCAGAGLAMSAFGIWLVGGGIGSPGLMLMKLGVSLFMLIVGMSMIVMSKSQTRA